MQAGVRRGGERRALDEIAAGVGHAQRVVDRQIVNRPRVGVAMRVGGEVSGHVLDQLARVGADGGREQHGGQIRSAAAERRDGAAGAHAEEARHDDDARGGQRGQQAQRPHGRSGRSAPRLARQATSPVWWTLNGIALTPMRWRCSASRATERSSPVDHRRSRALFLPAPV